MEALAVVWRPPPRETPSEEGPPRTFGCPLQRRPLKNVWDSNGVSKVPPIFKDADLADLFSNFSKNGNFCFLERFAFRIMGN